MLAKEKKKKEKGKKGKKGRKEGGREGREGGRDFSLTKVNEPRSFYYMHNIQL